MRRDNYVPDKRNYVVDRTKDEGSYDQGYLCIQKDTGELYWRPEGDNGEGKKEADKLTYHEAWIIVRALRLEARLGSEEPEYRYTMDEVK